MVTCLGSEAAVRPIIAQELLLGLAIDRIERLTAKGRELPRDRKAR
jgi:hypothetical protein